MPSTFVDKLLHWYQLNARDLPWRGHSDPYAVWVSEIMLQQTQVETVIPYFGRWMQRFPTIAALASADQQDVLAAWEGLGYYSRARNLHKSAQVVVAQHGGELPGDVTALGRLPGVGRYTAGAIASLAFGLDEPALDGNLRRVLARLFNVDIPARSTQGERRLWELAAEHLPSSRAADYNQALMDLGATICTPRNPDCPRCPLAEDCRARQLGLQEERPVLSEKRSQPHYIVTAAVIHKRGRVLIAQRPAHGLLGGLWEFPGGKLQPGEDLASCLQREILEELGVRVLVGGWLGVYRHAYTHFRVTLHAFECTLANGSRPQLREHAALKWVAPAELPNYPMGKIDRLIASKLIEANRILIKNRSSIAGHAK
jgi:A/G-specific adenine glycosylase